MDLSELFKSTLLIGPELSLIIAGLIVIVLDPIIKGSGKKYLFAIALLGIAIGFVLNLERFGITVTAFSGALSLDQFAAYFNIIFLIGAFLALILSRDYLSENGKYSNEFLCTNTFFDFRDDDT